MPSRWDGAARTCARGLGLGQRAFRKASTRTFPLNLNLPLQCARPDSGSAHAGVTAIWYRTTDTISVFVTRGTSADVRRTTLPSTKSRRRRRKKMFGLEIAGLVFVAIVF